MRRKLTIEEFIEKSRRVHKGKYTYEHVVYVNNRTHIKITCPKHGLFLHTPNNHLNGQGCLKCKYEEQLTTSRKDINDVISAFKKRHGDKYDYRKCKYKGADKPIVILCSIHGEFTQIAGSHLQGHGCPKCKKSGLENEVEKSLLSKNIDYVFQYRPSFLRTSKHGQLSIDFYLPDFNTAIECQGIQHFEAIEYFGGEKTLESIKERDKRKFLLCKTNGIMMEYIIYNENVEDRINDILEKNNKGRQDTIVGISIDKINK